MNIDNMHSNILSEISKNTEDLPSSFLRNMYNYYINTKSLSKLEWKEVRDLLTKYPKYAYLIAKREKCKGNPEFEATIRKDPVYLLRYIKYVLHKPDDRFTDDLKVESYIYDDYCKFISTYNTYREKLNTPKHVPVILTNIATTFSYPEIELPEKYKIKNRIVFESMKKQMKFVRKV